MAQKQQKATILKLKSLALVCAKFGQAGRSPQRPYSLSTYCVAGIFFLKIE
tara:strand:+ start:1616 stop:1768 length:153 start_codon:yes stop_codon:yes gene_type:complete